MIRYDILYYYKGNGDQQHGAAYDKITGELWKSQVYCLS